MSPSKGIVTILSKQQRTICSQIKKARKEAGLTQKEFAEAIKVTEVYIKGVEQERFNPNADVILTVCRKFGKDPNWVFAWKGNTTEPEEN